MIQSTALAKLERLAAHLPFHLDDVKRANETFFEWINDGKKETLKIVDIWTYCFVWRNLLVKFARSPELDPADFELLVARVFERIVERRHTIRDHRRYASWVSVVCRNQFVNYVRSPRKNIPIKDWQTAGLLTEPDDTSDDVLVLLQALESAIHRLPEYLREIARLRIVGHLTYDEIKEKTGKKIEVVRSYVNKALQRLREDEQLTLFIKREYREDL